MKRVYDKVANPGLAVINGELRNVSIVSIRIVNDRYIYTLRDVGEVENLVTYMDRVRFKDGEPFCYSVNVPSFVELEDGKMLAWRMVDGQPVCERLDDVPLTVRGIFAMPELPEGYYPTRRDCLRNSTYVEVDADGKRTEHTGILKKMRLTPEQRKYIKDVVEPALKGASERGIQILLSEDDCLVAFNSGGFNRLEWGDDSVSNRDMVGYNEMEGVSGDVLFIGAYTTIYDDEE